MYQIMPPGIGDKTPENIKVSHLIVVHSVFIWLIFVKRESRRRCNGIRPEFVSMSLLTWDEFDYGIWTTQIGIVDPGTRVITFSDILLQW